MFARLFHPSRRRNEASCLIDSLPSEILHYILYFCAKDFHGIIHFSTICKQWKEIADHSLLWLTSELSFYTTDEYFKKIVPNSTSEKREFADITAFRIYINSAWIQYQTWPLKICLERERLPKHFHDWCSKYQLDDDSVGEGDEKLKSEIIFSLIPKIHYRVNLTDPDAVRSRFMIVFRQYNFLWRWHTSWPPWLKKIEDKVKSFYANYHYEGICFVVSITMHAAAIYLFSDLENNSSSLTWLNHLGFACIYLYLICIFVLILLNCLKDITYILPSHHRPLDAPLLWDRYLPYTFLLLPILGICGALIMLEIKLSTAQILHYWQTTLPLWIFFSFSYLFSLLWLKYGDPPRGSHIFFGIISFVIHLMAPLGFTLIAVLSDNLSTFPIHSAQYAVIPFYPVELAVFLFLLVCIYNNYRLLSDYCRGHPVAGDYQLGSLAPTTTKLLFSFGVTFFCFGALILIIYMNVLFLQGGISLGEGMALSVVVSFLFYGGTYSLLIADK